MLNAKTLVVLKSLLDVEYSNYGYTSDKEFTENIELAIDEAKELYMVPAIGEGYYDDLSTIQYSDYSSLEKYFIYAEAYFSAYVFLGKIADAEYSRKKFQFETHSTATGSYSNSGITGKHIISNKYYKKAMMFMNQAGYFMSKTLSNTGIDNKWTYDMTRSVAIQLRGLD